jgi:DNA mismatch repair protein MutS2
MSKETLPTPDPAQELADAEAAIFAAELGSVPTIDLHDQTPDQAISMLDGFLNHECVQGTEAVKIIHGRGSGKMRKAVIAFLREHPLVRLVKDASHLGQQGGVTYVALEKIGQ